MLIDKTYEINSCDDVELNIKRESKLEFKLSFDDEKQIKAIVCIISGYGGDANDSYKEHLAQTIAKEYEVAILSVNYHCIGNRVHLGGYYFLDNIDRYILQEVCKSLNINLPNNLDNLIHIFDYINNSLIYLKTNNFLDLNYKPCFSVSLQPTKNEYQNFGIMQAIDILNALLYIKTNLPFKITGGGIKTIFIGSSHGGYLANLCAKISPWNVDYVIDNSSYAKTPIKYLGFGKEIDYVKLYEANDVSFDHININLFTKTYWTSNKFLSNYFSKARRLIRDILNKEHLKIQSLYPKPKYIFYHSKFDCDIAPCIDKEELIKILKDLNFDIFENIIMSEKDIDGKFIKDLTHGMGMSIKLLIKKHLSDILNEKNENKICKKEISYESDDLIYTFKEENNQINLYINNKN